MRHGFDGWALSALLAMAAGSVLLSGCGIIFQNHEKRADATLLPTPGNADARHRHAHRTRGRRAGLVQPLGHAAQQRTRAAGARARRLHRHQSAGRGPGVRTRGGTHEVRFACSKATSPISAPTRTARRPVSSSRRMSRSTACARWSGARSCSIATPPTLTRWPRTAPVPRSRAASSALDARRRAGCRVAHSSKIRAFVWPAPREALPAMPDSSTAGVAGRAARGRPRRRAATR